MESGKKFAWLHHRIPAIIETNKDVENWLEEDDYKIAVSNLVANVPVLAYSVSSIVNNNRNQDENLFEPVAIEEKKMKESASSKFMASWLNSKTEMKHESLPNEEPAKTDTK